MNPFAALLMPKCEATRSGRAGTVTTMNIAAATRQRAKNSHARRCMSFSFASARLASQCEARDDPRGNAEREPDRRVAQQQAEQEAAGGPDRDPQSSCVFREYVHRISSVSYRACLC